MVADSKGIGLVRLSQALAVAVTEVSLTAVRKGKTFWIGEARF